MIALADVRHVNRLLFAIGVCLAGAACAHLGHKAAPQMLGAADNGRTITLKVGEVSMLRLPANPGTGYVWQTISGADPRVLIVMDKGYDRPVSDAPGTPGQAWWKLRATGEGTTSLAMRYVRPWETDAKAEEFAVNVTVVSTR